jgi:[ribosomal protein S18]-alanine N-acetyltransferase
MSGSLRIRSYTASDKTTLISILRKNTPKYFAPEEEIEFVHFLEDQIEEYFVVEYQGSIVGSGGINFFDKGKTAVISWGMIDPDHHGQGLGSYLLNFRIERVVSIHRPERFLVRTAQFTYKFFEKFGFKLIHTEKDFWTQGIDLYEMEYDLKKKDPEEDHPGN